MNEKFNHDILLKLERDLINYNIQAKREQVIYEKEKQALASNPHSHSPILSQETKAYLDKQINESKELEKKCKEIIQITSKTILEMENLYNKVLQLEKEANNVKAVLTNQGTAVVIGVKPKR
ncbi:hypothetical protein [Borrelia persica]|uniref:hypothetical protein n=1 Tax=Borrelia persica TaxID=44448 RepID=UPI0004641A10|nr:hypothetical protein [Borrelia persica]